MESDRYFAAVEQPSAQIAVVTIRFAGGPHETEAAAVRQAALNLFPGAESIQLDPTLDTRAIEHLGRIVGKDGEAGLKSPSIVILVHGKPRLWFIDFAGRQEAVKSFLVDNHQAIRELSQGSRPMLERGYSDEDDDEEKPFWKSWWAHAGAGVAIALILIKIANLNGGEESSSAAPALSAEEVAELVPLSIERRPDGYYSLTLRNNSDVPLERVSYRCTFSRGNGEAAHSQTGTVDTQHVFAPGEEVVTGLGIEGFGGNADELTGPAACSVDAAGFVRKRAGIEVEPSVKADEYGNPERLIFAITNTSSQPFSIDTPKIMCASRVTYAPSESDERNAIKFGDAKFVERKPDRDLIELEGRQAGRNDSTIEVSPGATIQATAYHGGSTYAPNSQRWRMSHEQSGSYYICWIRSGPEAARRPRFASTGPAAVTAAATQTAETSTQDSVESSPEVDLSVMDAYVSPDAATEPDATTEEQSPPVEGASDSSPVDSQEIRPRS